ncbi:MAG: UvrD-helicase domain-containing protein [Bdellovibrionaceae bacterium]|nr:UvrD-helicase domain-containing protein [Pseudobdellovibrionaceae bacterium]
MTDWTRGLNPEQARAVNHSHGPLLILAGAGSGKTTVLVSRTGRMIDDGIVKADGICVLTFTNKAARELKHRVSVKVGAKAKGLWAGTFHSFGLQMLRKYHEAAGLPAQFGVIDMSDSQSVVRELLKNLTVAGKDKFDLEKVLNLVQEFRARGRFANPDGDEYHAVAEALAPQYQKKLKALGVVDFEELLLKPVALLKENAEIREKIQRQYPYLMVDEFQDTNAVQMKLLEYMMGPERNMAVVGDDDQSIYGWRGAEVSNILDYPKRYSPCEVIRLERNYRSTSKILDLANHVIGQNDKRHGKVLKPESSRGVGGEPELFVFSNEEEEAEYVLREIKQAHELGRPYKEMAVLYRSNSQSGILEGLMRQEQIPFAVSGGTALFDRKEVKDVLAYLRLSLSANDLAFRRILNVPSRGIGDTSIEKIVEYMNTHKMGFIKASRLWKEIGIQDKAGEAIDQLHVFLSTLAGRLLNDPSLMPGAKLVEIMKEIGYRDLVWNTSKDPVAGEKRWLGVEILARILDRFVERGGRDQKTLLEFVDAMELRDDQEDDQKKSEVSLMTLHASKGLEFPIVFLIGIEEDLLPHRTLGSDISEERRLFYVGITRAQEKLYLSRCRTRKRYGQAKPVSPSRFILGLPKGLMVTFEEGVRPVSGEARDSLMANFMASLNAKSGARPK